MQNFFVRHPSAFRGLAAYAFPSVGAFDLCPGRDEDQLPILRAFLSNVLEAVTIGTLSGCLREGAKSYVKRLRPERESALGQRYSPVKLMCSHPRGEMWARNSASPSFSVFQ